jgi:predicted CXXCH cytochrome family protein
MTSKKSLKLAYGLAIYCLFVAVVSYAAFPINTPEKPVRIMYWGMAGNVLFDHNTHASVPGYGVNCSSCHHDLEGDDTGTPEACSACHDPAFGDEDMLKRADAFHAQCIGCHQDFGAGPEDCAGCHVTSS